MGAWIEIYESHVVTIYRIVASFMGAWIEIIQCCIISMQLLSHPLWVRGLKYFTRLRYTS